MRTHWGPKGFQLLCCFCETLNLTFEMLLFLIPGAAWLLEVICPPHPHPKPQWCGGAVKRRSGVNSRWDAGAYPPTERSGQREMLGGWVRNLCRYSCGANVPPRRVWFGSRVDTDEAAAPVASRKELSEG